MNNDQTLNNILLYEVRLTREEVQENSKQVAVLSEKVETLIGCTDKLERAIYGNGHGGIKQTVESHEKALTELMDDWEERRRQIKSEIEIGKTQWRKLKIALILMAVGIAVDIALRNLPF